MRNDVATMEAGPAGADAAVGRVRWDPGWWVLRGLERAGWVRRLALRADLPHRPALVTWPAQTLQGSTT